jgi:hypothetical protein
MEHPHILPSGSNSEHVIFGNDNLQALTPCGSNVICLTNANYTLPKVSYQHFQKVDIKQINHNTFIGHVDRYHFNPLVIKHDTGLINVHADNMIETFKGKLHRSIPKEFISKHISPTHDVLADFVFDAFKNYSKININFQYNPTHFYSPHLTNLQNVDHILRMLAVDGITDTQGKKWNVQPQIIFNNEQLIKQEIMDRYSVLATVHHFQNMTSDYKMTNDIFYDDYPYNSLFSTPSLTDPTQYHGLIPIRVVGWGEKNGIKYWICISNTHTFKLAINNKRVNLKKTNVQLSLYNKLIIGGGVRILNILNST